MARKVTTVSEKRRRAAIKGWKTRRRNSRDRKRRSFQYAPSDCPSEEKLW